MKHTFHKRKQGTVPQSTTLLAVRESLTLWYLPFCCKALWPMAAMLWRSVIVVVVSMVVLGCVGVAGIEP